MTQVHYIYCALYFKSSATADLTGYWLMAQRLGNPALDVSKFIFTMLGEHQNQRSTDIPKNTKDTGSKK